MKENKINVQPWSDAAQETIGGQLCKGKIINTIHQTNHYAKDTFQNKLCYPVIIYPMNNWDQLHCVI